MESDVGSARGATPIDRELMPIRLEISEPGDTGRRAERDDSIGMTEPIVRGQLRREAEPGAAELVELLAGGTGQAGDPTGLQELSHRDQFPRGVVPGEREGG
ncbi:hypothetical protein [Kribbella qitaiheensis]|uniref:hypothetical protein n=1 Tax=Kribbella qitaiheensis TaxID=1544730 RepID=UPI001FE68F14|nr:hypothetical protein [Kribbella qitaiheensis]